MTDPQQNETQSPIFEGTLFLSPNIDYFRNGDDFFVYHNIYGYILKMSEDLVDFLEFFQDAPKSADELMAQIGEAFDAETLNGFLSIFRTLACLLPDENFETQKTRDMYPTLARWITVDQTDPTAVVMYVFDTQARRAVTRIQLDAWESKLWQHIRGEKTVAEIAEILAGENNEAVESTELRVAATLALWSHCDVQAVKLSAEPCGNFRGRRFGVPPYLVSTMPYEKVTQAVRTEVDEEGNCVALYEELPRAKPSDMALLTIDENTLEQDRRGARLSALFSAPHAALADRSYGDALLDVFKKYGAIRGETCRVLEITDGDAKTVRAFLEACQRQAIQTKFHYTLYTASESMAAALREALADLPNVEVVSGELDRMADVLEGKPFDIIYSNEYLANLASVSVRKISLGGKDEEEEEDEDEEIQEGGNVGERTPEPYHAEAASDRMTFIGEGDAIHLIFKYKLSLADSPEDFLLNSGSLRLLGQIAKLSTFTTQVFLVEFGEEVKYPIQTFEDGDVAFSQHFGILKQAAKTLGFLGQTSYWMEEIGLVRNLPMFATTRSQFKAIRQMLQEHGQDLARNPYTKSEFEKKLADAQRTNVVEINYEPAEDRVSGLVPHAYKLLRLYRELEF